MARILVVGIAVVDAIAHPVDAFPAPGGLRFFDELTFTTGGCAINCGIALAKLGIPSDIVARVGQDPLGDFVISELARAGASTSGIVRDPQRPTSFSFVAVPRGGERSFLHTTGANAALRASEISPQQLASKQLVFVTGTMLMDALDGEPAAGLLKAARSAGALTVMDTVYVESAPIELWRRAVLPALAHLDYFVPSAPEARAISGIDDASESARSFQRQGARNVVIKLGDRGVLCLDEHGRETIVPAFQIPRVVDATGAGDCWAAGFLAGLHEGRSFVESARLGNAVAAISVQAAGATTGVPTMDQVQNMLDGQAGREDR
ncbi:MAG: carbohydrate kinase family protein [Phycisphaerales bacterium]|nr:carbohydrate kinase family protein [Phycisphaerales bacterium]